MTSFVNSALLVDELFYKFMLKYDTQNLIVFSEIQ